MTDENFDLITQKNTELPICTVQKLSFLRGGNDKYSSIFFDYISDIHLLHHIDEKGVYPLNVVKEEYLQETIKNVSESLAKTIQSNFILFGGDVGSPYMAFGGDLTWKHSCVEFFNYFVDYLKSLPQYQKPLSYDEWKIENLEYYKNEEKRLQEQLKQVASKITTFREKQYSTTENYTNFLHNHSRELKKCSEEERIAIQEYFNARNNLQRATNKANGNLEDEYSWNYLKNFKRFPTILFVMGNHEFFSFNSIEEGVTYYEKHLPKEVTLLQNTSKCVIYRDGTKALLFGGTGFAKYNPKYNAETLYCCINFTREDEIKEGTLFETAYEEAKAKARENNAIFICLTHYSPLDSCLKQADNGVVYFYGHNHRNYLETNEDRIIYGDNQIGYKKKNILFKTAVIGRFYNPYYHLPDGYYESNASSFKMFNWFVGEVVGSGNVERYVGKGYKFYVVKNQGYYGFFLENKNQGKIFILSGGTVKRIHEYSTIEEIYELFPIIVNKTIETFKPLFVFEKQISEKISNMGFDGCLHGSIIDLDYYHHIMFNPIDGTITVYFSPYFGCVKRISSCKDLIDSLKTHSLGRILTIRSDNVVELPAKKKLTQEEKDFFNTNIFNQNVIAQNHDTNLDEYDDYDDEYIDVGKTGMYSISRKLKSYQRIFDKCILREFNVDFIKSLTNQGGRKLGDKNI